MLKRRDVVNEIWRDVQQIFSHDQRRDLIAENVSQQLKQREHQQQHEEGGHDHGQIHAEVAQHVVVQDHGEAGAEHAAATGGALENIFGAAEWAVRAASCIPASNGCHSRRREAISNGLCSARHSRKAPPRKKTMSASHTPKPGDNFPCRASETPTSDAE